MIFIIFFINRLIGMSLLPFFLKKSNPVKMERLTFTMSNDL